MAKKKKELFPAIKLDLDGLMKQLNMVSSDLNNFKIRTGQQSIDFRKMILEIRKEVTNLTKYFASMLDLISDTSNIPGNVIISRFMQYCADHEIMDNFGNVSGGVNISKYNF